MKRKALTQKERAEAAEFLHAEFLRLFLLKSRYTVRDLVFHGGTSLRILHGSPRHSEDLDFMVSARITPELDRKIGAAARLVGAAAAMRWPQASVQWRGKGTSGRLLKGFLVLSCPAWHGNVKVKIECYTAHDMSRYVATSMSLRSGVVVPTATLESIMGDKVVALAMRPYFKERDVFDVWWLRQRGVRPSADRIEASAAVYGYTMEEVMEGLSTLDARMPDAETIEKSLSRWLPADLYRHFRSAALFGDLRAAVLQTRDEATHLAP